MEIKEEIKYWYNQIALRNNMIYGKYHSVQYRNKRFHRICLFDQIKINISKQQILEHIEKLKLKIKIMDYYEKETFPPNIKFVEDTPHTRQICAAKIGKPKFFLSTDWAYIEIDTKEKTWRTHLSVFWMYRNQPPLIDVFDALELLNK